MDATTPPAAPRKGGAAHGEGGAAAAPTPFGVEPATPAGLRPGPAAPLADPGTATAAAPAAAAAGRVRTAAQTAAVAAAAGLAAARNSAAAAAAARQTQQQQQLEEISEADEDEDDSAEGQGGSLSDDAGEAVGAGGRAGPSQPRRAPAWRPRMGAALARHASGAGLAGLADAAGRALADLPRVDLLSWRERVLLTRLAAGLLLTLAMGCALLFAPRRFSARTEASLLLRGGVHNGLTFVLWCLLGLVPMLLQRLMWPSLGSLQDKVSLAAHLNWSYLLGSFPLLLYLARWQPPARRSSGRPTVRPASKGAAAVLAAAAAAAEAEAEAPAPYFLQRTTDTRAATAAVTAAVCGLLALAAAASPATWAHAGFLATHSWGVHIMLLDLGLLHLLSPALVLADARARGLSIAGSAAGAALLLAAMAALPFVGPGLYLLLRPEAPDIMTVLLSASGRGAAAAAGGGRRQQQHEQEEGAWLTLPLERAAGRVGDGTRRATQQAVAAAAAVPLPSERTVRAAAVGGGRLVAGSVRAAAAGLTAGARHVARGVLWLVTGGHPDLASAARTSSQDETFVDFDAQQQGGGHPAPAGTAADAAAAAAAAGLGVDWIFNPHPELGEGAFCAPAAMGDGSLQLLYAPGYAEDEADDASSLGDDVEDSGFDSSSDEEDESDDDGGGGEADASAGAATGTTSSGERRLHRAAQPGGVLQRVGAAAAAGAQQRGGGSADSGGLLDTADLDGDDEDEDEDEDEELLDTQGTEQQQQQPGRTAPEYGGGGGDSVISASDDDGEEELQQPGEEAVAAQARSADRRAKVDARQRLQQLHQQQHPRSSTPRL